MMRTLLFLGVALLAPSLNAAMISLGPAQDFNIFVFGDHTQSFVDAGGRVAVGGNATYAHYGIGTSLPSSTTRADLIVGGDIDITGGTNFNGNTAISSTGSVINYSMTNNNGVPGQPLVADLIDFAAAQADLIARSNTWAALAPTGSVAVNFGQLDLTGSDPLLNVFNIDGNDIGGSGFSLATLNGINVIAPETSTVLINILGDNVGFGSYQIFVNGGQPNSSVDATRFMWNFSEANYAFNQHIGVIGSILAPNADYTGFGGNIDGTLVANSLNGAVELHDFQFEGDLPPPTPGNEEVPEPTTLSLFGAGLLALAYATRKRRRG